MRPRRVARCRHLTAADQSHIGDRLVRGVKRTGRDHRRTVAREASDAVEACGLKGFGQRHRRQDGGEPPRQHRLACPGGRRKRKFRSERLHDLQVRLRTQKVGVIISSHLSFV
jgi:hypothetical protein